MLNKFIAKGSLEVSVRLVPERTLYFSEDRSSLDVSRRYERLQPQIRDGLFFTNFTNHMLQKYEYEISYTCGQTKFT